MRVTAQLAPASPIGRVVLFHLAWSALLVASITVAQLLVPSQTTVWYWYVLLAPLSWLLIAVGLLPVTLAIHAGLARLGRGAGRLSRTRVFAISVAVWVALALAAAAVAPPTPETALRAAIALAIAIPLFGLLFPLTAFRTAAALDDPVAGGGPAGTPSP